MDACHHSLKVIRHRQSVYLVVDLGLGVSRELLKLRIINLLELRTRERTGDLADGTGDGANSIGGDVWLGLGGELVGETREVVVLAEGVAVVSTTSEVTDVNASERVGLSGVTVKGSVMVCGE